MTDAIINDPVIYNHSLHAKYIPDLVPLLTLASSHQNAGMHFIPPWDNDDRILRYWESKVQDPTAVTFLTLASLPTTSSSSTSASATTTKEERQIVAGVVILQSDVVEIGRSRAHVNKLLVHPDYQRKGIAGKLMRALEDVAREKGKNILRLDTQKGLPAEAVYQKLGYIKVGETPAWIERPMDGVKATSVCYYKLLE